MEISTTTPTKYAHIIHIESIIISKKTLTQFHEHNAKQLNSNTTHLCSYVCSKSHSKNLYIHKMNGYKLANSYTTI